MGKLLKEKYQEEIIPELIKILKKDNVFELPRLSKVVLNVGVGKDSKDSKFIEAVENNLAMISGQKPIRTNSKKSISNFKLRKGQVTGVKVTIRGDRMFSFLEKLIYITLPRVKDFRGISPKSLDGNGNLNIGFREQVSFPEIISEAIERLHGLELTIVTTAKDNKSALELFKLLGIPFKK